jgi:demethylmenaquinone methyltransferase/2-methoxy-6-polyprenyl-1,4-benzoquinol methylase
MSRSVQEMFRSISSRYDLANDVLSLGIHHIWRKKLRKRARLAMETRALDLCSGTGDVAIELHKSFPGRVCGIDFVEEMLSLASQKERTIPFMVADAMHLPFLDNSFGLATVSFGIRNVDEPLGGLREIFRVLKPGSQVFVLEFGQPNVPLLSKLYQFYSAKIIPFIGEKITGNRSAYEYLPKTSSAFPCRESFVALMREAGFKNCRYSSLSFGIAYLYEGIK